MRVQQIADRLRTLLEEEGDFATVLRGAGLVVVIISPCQCGWVRQRDSVGALDGTFRIWTLQFRNRLHDAALIPRNVRTAGSCGTLCGAICGCQQLAACSWFHEEGSSSWLAFGCGALFATLAIGVVLIFKTYLDPAFVAPTIVATLAFQSSL